MKKIVIITSAYHPTSGGVANATKGFAEALAEFGCETHILTFKSFRSKLTSQEVINKVFIHRITLVGKIFKLLRVVSKWVALYVISLCIRQKIKEIKPDIIMGQMVYWGGVLAAFSKRYYSKTITVAFAHGEDVNQLSGNRIKILFTKYSLKHNDLIFTTNSDFAGNLRSYVDKEIKILPNVFLNMVQEINYQERLRNKDFKILCIGRLNSYNGIEIKGFSSVLKAMESLQNCKLDIIGDGPLMKEYQEYSIKHDLVDKVEFHRKLDREVTLNYINKSHVVALPSNIEGLSMVMIEAMHYGVPLIATRVGGAKDYVKNGVNGFLIDKNDVKSIVEKIKQLQNNPELLLQMSRNARDTYLNNFTPSRVVDKFNKIINKVEENKK